MGEHSVDGALGGEVLRDFLKHLLQDLRALEWLLEHESLEDDRARIGAEQELFLVDELMRPAPRSMEILAAIDDPHFVTEIGRFNLEINLDPMEFAGDCLSRLERNITEAVERVRAAGAPIGVQPTMVGILPTIRLSDLTVANLTPLPRYAALDESLSRLRGGPYEFRIKGTDELILKHDSVVVEASNASFQVHLQLGASEFASWYNIAQAITGPVLAAAVNSPLFLGRRLWRETRIALFQQAVDTRTASGSLRERSPRVTFGSKWVEKSVLELYREDVARFRVLLGANVDEDPFERIAAGEPPELMALRIHNGTVYRWNRPCYGITDGKPHLRIENRVLPSGPTPVDEVANSAFWLGLMEGLHDEIGDVSERMHFDDARQNYVAAARLGLAASFTWLEGESIPAQELICERLLPIAAAGLRKRGVDDRDVDRYLGVIDQRVASGRTGASWLVRSYDDLRGVARPGERLAAVTDAMIKRQRSGAPVGEWPLAKPDESSLELRRGYSRVEHFMSTDLFTVHEDEPIDLVASLMDWKHIRHVPVEDNQNRLVGVVSYRALIRLVATGVACGDRILPVREIMRRNPVTIAPETPTVAAIAIMRENGISSLPVIENGVLVGMVSERDFMEIASALLTETLSRADGNTRSVPERYGGRGSGRRRGVAADGGGSSDRRVPIGSHRLFCERSAVWYTAAHASLRNSGHGGPVVLLDHRDSGVRPGHVRRTST